jgi:hypothetical protein
MGLVLLLWAPAVEVVLVEVQVEVAPAVEVVLVEVQGEVAPAVEVVLVDVWVEVVAAVELVPVEVPPAAEGVLVEEVVAALRSVHCVGAILRCNLVWSFGHLYLAFCNGVCTTAET